MTVKVNRLTVLALVIVVVLAGCSSIDSLTGSSTPETTDTPTTTPTPTPTTTTETPSPTPTTVVKTAPGSSEWSPPQTPNKPTQDKMEDDRIDGVEFVDQTDAKNGSGVSNFNLAITANTTMEDVDPPDHGDVIGEPYFLVKIDGTPVERSAILNPRQDKEYETFNVSVQENGLEQFDPGTLDVKVIFFDRDADYDDVYDVWTGTIEYTPN